MSVDIDSNESQEQINTQRRMMANSEEMTFEDSHGLSMVNRIQLFKKEYKEFEKLPN